MKPGGAPGQPPGNLDALAVRRNFARAAPGYNQAAALAREVAGRMASRLDYVRLTPARILDAGCGTGADLNLLGERYPGALRLGCDIALPMLAQAGHRSAWLRRLLPRLSGGGVALLGGDAAHLPLVHGSVDLLWSNLMLHWANDPLAVLGEFRRVLAVGGLLMFSTLGPDTLRELRRAFAAADRAPHVHRFVDMHDVGDMLVAAGFAQPVMDMEVITLTYRSLDDLLHELRAAGASNADACRGRGLLGKRAWHRVIATYEAMRRDARLPATFEVIYGHAWKPEPRTTEDGRTIVRFDRPRRA
ncbi:MAG: malonyl-ACP O-methyltransferase BioC [Betaproteobacteria bacterium]|nr:malonyl-ACP O-methyltransferase BioC [Betaproteobacteria bacterium]